MIKLGKKTNISLVQKKNISDENKQQKNRKTISSAFRPKVVDAKVYKVKSSFVKNSVFVTLGYISENGKKRPFEIFINSKNGIRPNRFVVKIVTQFF